MDSGLIKRVNELYHDFNLSAKNTVGIERFDKVGFDNFITQRKLIKKLNWVYKLNKQEYFGMKNIPLDGPFIIAMNHTSSFDSGPFQCKMFERFEMFNGQGKVATAWAKGEHMKFRFIDNFFERMGFIPVPSKNYLLNQMYRYAFGKSAHQFIGIKTIKEVLDEKISLKEARDRYFDPETKGEVKSFLDRIDTIRDYNQQIMFKVGDLSKQAFDEDLYLLVFPSGTRSKKLGVGRPGLAQLALHSKVPVIPVGCNSKIYPFNYLPVQIPGMKTKFVVGEPVDLSEFEISNDFVLFSKESQKQYEKEFQGATNVIMKDINKLLDLEYQNNALYG